MKAARSYPRGSSDVWALSSSIYGFICTIVRLIQFLCFIFHFACRSIIKLSNLISVWKSSDTMWNTALLIYSKSFVKKPLSRQKNLSSCSCEYSRRLMARKWTFWIFQGTVATFYRWGRQICNFLVWIFLRIPCTKIIKICLFSYSNNNRVALFGLQCIYLFHLTPASYARSVYDS